MRQSEKQIENQILSWLKSKRIMAWKVKTVGTFDAKLGKFRKPSAWYRKGVADILGIFKKRPLAIEVKSASGRLSKEQKEFLQEFADNGGIAMVARSVEAVEKALDDCAWARRAKEGGEK